MRIFFRVLLLGDNPGNRSSLDGDLDGAVIGSSLDGDLDGAVIGTEFWIYGGRVTS